MRVTYNVLKGNAGVHCWGEMLISCLRDTLHCFKNDRISLFNFLSPRKTQQECGLSDIKVDEGFEEKITYDYHGQSSNVYFNNILYLSSTNELHNISNTPSLGQSKSSTYYVGYVDEGCEIVLSNKHSDYIWAERGLALGEFCACNIGPDV